MSPSTFDRADAPTRGGPGRGAAPADAGAGLERWVGHAAMVVIGLALVAVLVI